MADNWGSGIFILFVIILSRIDVYTLKDHNPIFKTNKKYLRIKYKLDYIMGRYNMYFIISPQKTVYSGYDWVEKH